MARYEIQAPSGEVFEIEGPDNATDEQISAFAASQFGGGSPPSGPSPLPAEDPYKQNAEDMGLGQQILTGIGGAMVGAGRGIKQLVTGEPMDESTRRADEALYNTGGGITGNVLGNIGMAVVPGGAVSLAGRALGAVAANSPRLLAAANAMRTGGSAMALPTGYRAAAGQGAVLGGIQEQEGGRELGDRALGAGIGAAGGAVGARIGQSIGNAVRPSQSGLTQGQRAAQASGSALGFSQTPGYATGNKALQKLEAALSSNPVTSGGFDALNEGNQRILNRIAADSIGENSDELSSPVLERAFDRIGRVYERVKTNQPVRLDPIADTQRLMDVMDEYAGQFAGNNDVGNNALFSQFSNFIQRGGATQAQLAQLSSNLGKAVKNNMTTPSGDRAMGMALGDVKRLVDDSLQGSLSGDLAQDFAKARGQYRNLMLLTSGRGAVNPSSGNVSGRSLANTLQGKDRNGFMRNQNQTPLYNAARFSQAFPEVVGNSGTATRNADLLSMAAAVPARLATAAYLSRPAIAGAQATGRGITASQQALADALMRSSPALSAGSSPILAQLLMSQQQ